MGIMKRKTFILLCLICAICGLVFSHIKNPKQRIIKMVNNNIDSYTSIANQILIEGIAPSNIHADGIKDISSYNHLQVDFTCGYGGFASQSSYYGFYFSFDDVPRIFQGLDIPFEHYENGLRWSKIDGANWCYVEKISNYWYYLEIYF